ncbi:MAG: SUMF1/EgtB/PvdO family nonheme iron enzyme [Gemmatimonadota bacterium]
MSGNVLEWVADRYSAQYYTESPMTNPPGPETGRFRVIRGGGWHSEFFSSTTRKRRGEEE